MTLSEKITKEKEQKQAKEARRKRQRDMEEQKKKALEEKKKMKEPVPRGEMRMLFNTLVTALNKAQDHNIMLERRLNYMERCIQVTSPLVFSKKELVIEEMTKFDEYARGVSELKDPETLLVEMEKWLGNESNIKFLPLLYIRDCILQTQPKDLNDPENVKHTESLVRGWLERLEKLKNEHLPELEFFLKNPAPPQQAPKKQAPKKDIASAEAIPHKPKVTQLRKGE